MLRHSTLRRATTTTSHTTAATVQRIRTFFSPDFRPPALHVLYDPVTNHRFCEATVNLTIGDKNASPRSAASVLTAAEARAAFLVWDGPGETTLTAKHSDPVPYDPASVALFGFSEVLCAARLDAGAPDKIRNETLRFQLAQLTQAATQISPTTPQKKEEEEKSLTRGLEQVATLFLTELDYPLWFMPGQREILLRNLEAFPRLRIACTKEWHRALSSQEGLEELLESAAAAAATTTSTTASQSKNQRGSKNSAATTDRAKKLTSTWASPQLPRDRIVHVEPQKKTKVGERREVTLVANTWCDTPVYEDSTTKSLFCGAQGLAACVPWMEGFAAPMQQAGAVRAHPPLILPFWPSVAAATATATAFPPPRAFNAARAQQLVKYILDDVAPQRLFLERYGMVTPADEFLEKLEVVAQDLCAMQQRLAQTITSSSSADALADGGSSGGGKLVGRVSERITQAVLCGDVVKDAAAAAAWKNLVDTRARQQPAMDRENADRALDPEGGAEIRPARMITALCETLVSLEHEIAASMTVPFVAGAQRMAVKIQKEEAEKAAQIVNVDDDDNLVVEDSKPAAKKPRGRPAAATAKQQQQSQQPAEPISKRSGPLSPKELSVLIQERVGDAEIASAVLREDIDSLVFAAMTEAELQQVFAAKSFGVKKKLAFLQKSLA